MRSSDGPTHLRHVRMCANKVVAGVRWSALLPNIRSEDTRQFASAQQIKQLEGLAVAIPWGFESPLTRPSPYAFGLGGTSPRFDGRDGWLRMVSANRRFD